MAKVRLIGLTGRAGSGKTLAAQYLVERHGFVSIGLADPIKALLNARFGWTPELWDNRTWKESPALAGYGYDTFSPRAMAQWLGTEVGRYIAGTDCWIKVLERSIDALPPATRIVVPDIRFANEVDFIHLLGGTVVELSRQTAEPVVAHSSEAGVPRDSVDRFIKNDGSPSDLYFELEYVLRGDSGC